MRYAARERKSAAVIGIVKHVSGVDPLDFLAEFTRPGVPGTPFRRRART